MTSVRPTDLATAGRFELTNLDLVELNLLFGMMGARSLPSVSYKVRVFPFQTGAVQGEV